MPQSGRDADNTGRSPGDQGGDVKSVTSLETRSHEGKITGAGKLDVGKETLVE